MALAERIEQSPEARRHGLTVWVDQRASGLQPGTPWQDQLEAAIQERSTAFALYLTRAGAEHWVRMEVRAALDRVIAAGRAGASYPFIPILAEDGLDIGLLPPFARQFQGVRLAEPDAVQRLIGALLERPAEMVALVDEPFRGLEAFGSKDAALFFGRELQTEELALRLEQTNLVMVAGDSGSGKSSLVKAGLVPAFKEGRFAPRLGPRPDPALWHVVEMRPLADPFEGLVEGISDAARTLEVNAGLLGDAFGRLRSPDAKIRSSALRDALREGAPPDAQILLVVDQFEELWTLSPDRARDAFLDGLLDLARPDDPSCRVVTTMRRDYYNLCSTHTEFFRRVEEHDRRGYNNLRRMDDEALRECIERPLALAGVVAADARRLADEVLRDAGDQPGDLALLEMALTEAWQERLRHGGDLLESYRAVGRVEGAIRKAADEVYDGLGERQRLAEPLFIRLVQLGDTGGTTRRIVHADELAPEVWKLAQHLGSKDGKRLLVLGGDPERTAELGHEQLVTQWPQYQLWLQGTETDPRAADKRTLDQLMARAWRWRGRGRKWRDLAIGSDLAEFRALKKRRASWLAPTETSFVGRSSRRKQAVRGGIVAAIILAGGIAAIFVWDQRQRTLQAERQQIEAVATAIGFQLELQNGHVERRDLEALALLAVAGRRERLAFVTELLRRPALAERFARNPAVVARALVGLDAVARREVISHAFGPESAPPESLDGRHARALLGTELATPEAIEPVLAAIQATTDPYALRALGKGLAALPVELTAEQAAAAVGPVLAAIRPSPDADDLVALGDGLAGLAQKLTAEQAGAVVNPVLAAIRATTDPWALRALREGLVAFAQKLTAEHAGAAVDPVLAAIQRTTNPDALAALGQGLAALPVELTAEQVRAAVDRLLAAIQRTTDWSASQTLGEGLAAFAQKLTAEEAGAAVDPVLAAIQATTDPDALTALREGLAAFAQKLTAEQAGAAVEPVLAAIQGTTDPDALRALGQGLAALPVELTAEQVRAAVGPALVAIQTTADPYSLRALGERLTALAPRLTAEQAGAAVDPVLAAIQRTTDPDALAALGQGLAALPAELTAEQAGAAVDPVLAAIQATNDPDALYALTPLGEGLAALARRLTAEQAGATVDAVLAAMMRGTTDSDALALGEGLAALARRLTAEQAGAAVDPALAAIRGTTNPDALVTLGHGLVALAAKLPDVQAVQMLVDTLKIPWMAGEPSGPLLQALQAKLGNEATRPVGLWETVALIEQRFGSAIDLTSPPQLLQ